MDFALPADLEARRLRVAALIDEHVLPLEGDPSAYDAHENIGEPALARVRALVKAAGEWAPQVPVADGGLGLDYVALAVLYEEMGRSIFGPVAFNCAAPDDGTMQLLAKVAKPAQKERWLAPIVRGEVRSSFAMTEPGGAGSDPANIATRAERRPGGWRITGRKWFITGADGARHVVLIARTSDDPRRGLTAFLYDARQPGWHLERRIAVMGPEEHGGHCELRYDGLEVPDDAVLGDVGDGLKMTQIRLGPARLTHCMRWLGMAKRALDIAVATVGDRRAFGSRILDRESVQGMIGEAAMQIEIGRLLVMSAAWQLDRGSRARTQISMAKIQVADTLHRAVDVAIQVCGARGYSRDLVLEWMYRYARQARLVDGASEVHRMVIASAFAQAGPALWSWPTTR